MARQILWASIDEVRKNYLSLTYFFQGANSRGFPKTGISCIFWSSKKTIPSTRLLCRALLNLEDHKDFQSTGFCGLALIRFWNFLCWNPYNLGHGWAKMARFKRALNDPLLISSQISYRLFLKIWQESEMTSDLKKCFLNHLKSEQETELPHKLMTYP